MNSITITAICIYPIKSLGGISLQSSLVEERGLQYDRRWMLVDENNRFITQRKFPKMALLKVALQPHGLQVTAPEMEFLYLPLAPANNKLITVSIWDDTCKAIEADNQTNGWFSEALQLNCKLVYMPDQSVRPVDTCYALHDEFVSFADAYPFLIIGEASLTDLNSRLAVAVPMNRFRPNIVIGTSISFAEDTWKSIRIGNSVFHLVKPCARCVLTTVDQQTGIASKEPLKTLASYRKTNNKVLFGQNALCEEASHTIRVGDKVEVIQNK